MSFQSRQDESSWEVNTKTNSILNFFWRGKETPDTVLKEPKEAAFLLILSQLDQRVDHQVPWRRYCVGLTVLGTMKAIPGGAWGAP